MELLSFLVQNSRYPVTQTYNSMSTFGDKLLEFSKKYKLKIVNLEKKVNVYNKLIETQMDDKNRKKYSRIKKNIIKTQALVSLLEYAISVTFELQFLKKIIVDEGDELKYSVDDFTSNED